MKKQSETCASQICCCVHFGCSSKTPCPAPSAPANGRPSHSTGILRGSLLVVRRLLARCRPVRIVHVAGQGSPACTPRSLLRAGSDRTTDHKSHDEHDDAGATHSNPPSAWLAWKLPLVSRVTLRRRYRNQSLSRAGHLRKGTQSLAIEYRRAQQCGRAYRCAATAHR